MLRRVALTAHAFAWIAHHAAAGANLGMSGAGAVTVLAADVAKFPQGLGWEKTAGAIEADGVAADAAEVTEFSGVLQRPDGLRVFCRLPLARFAFMAGGAGAIADVNRSTGRGLGTFAAG